MTSIFILLACFFTSIELKANSKHDIGNQKVVLDEEEQKISETYLHEGLAKQKRKELCKKAGKAEGCDDEKDLNVFFGILPPQGVEIAAKVYGMVIGAGALGDKFALREEAPKTEAASGTNPETSQTETPQDKSQAGGETQEEVSDNCRYIAAATEGIAQITQFTKLEEIKKRKSKESMQVQALYKIAEKHESKSSVATMQAIGWGATAGCYAFIAATQPINIGDPAFLLKLGGTALLATLFYEQSIKHKQYAEEVRNIAKALPKQGDCNPITKVYCYCAQESTHNDPKYCIPQTHKRKIAKNSTRVVCTDENMQADPNCKCAESDTCYDKKLITKLNNLKNADAGFADSFNDFKSLMKGELKGAKKANLSLTKSAARNSNKLRQIASKLPDKHLNKAQQASVNAFAKLGIPRRIGSTLATTPIKGNFNAEKRFKNNYRNYAKKRKKRKNDKVLYFSGGHGKKAVTGQQKNFNFSKFLKKKKAKRKTSSNKVLNFAKKATDRAAISRQKDKNIFEIISKRYQLSTKRRLE